MDYSSKYRKYKTKYIKLKAKIDSQVGGSEGSADLDSILSDPIHGVYLSVVKGIEARLNRDSAYLSALKQRLLQQRGGFVTIGKEDFETLVWNPESLGEDVKSQFRSHVDELRKSIYNGRVDSVLRNTGSLRGFRQCLIGALSHYPNSDKEWDAFKNVLLTNTLRIQQMINNRSGTGVQPLAIGKIVDLLMAMEKCPLNKKFTDMWFIVRFGLLRLMYGHDKEEQESEFTQDAPLPDTLRSESESSSSSSTSKVPTKSTGTTSTQTESASASAPSAAASAMGTQTDHDDIFDKFIASIGTQTEPEASAMGTQTDHANIHTRPMAPAATQTESASEMGTQTDHANIFDRFMASIGVQTEPVATTGTQTDHTNIHTRPMASTSTQTDRGDMINATTQTNPMASTSTQTDHVDMMNAATHTRPMTSTDTQTEPMPDTLGSESRSSSSSSSISTGTQTKPWESASTQIRPLPTASTQTRQWESVNTQTRPSASASTQTRPLESASTHIHIHDSRPAPPIASATPAAPADTSDLLAKIQGMEAEHAELKAEIAKLNKLIADHAASDNGIHNESDAKISKLRNDIVDVFTAILAQSAAQQQNLSRLRVMFPPYIAV